MPSSDASFRDSLTIAGDHLIVDQSLPDDWTVHYLFEPAGRGFRLARVVIAPGPNSGPLSTKGLRSMSPLKAGRMAHRLAAQNPGILRQADELQGTERWAGLTRPPAGRSIDDLWLAGVAYEYVRAVDHFEPAPAAKIAALLGVRPVQARDYLRRARKRGLLTTAKHGRAEGRLTEKAIALLGPMADGLRALAESDPRIQEED